jgi:hypothetical protein
MAGARAADVVGDLDYELATGIHDRRGQEIGVRHDVRHLSGTVVFELRAEVGVE